ncbi:Na+/H+ antiporter subunit B [Candidatus Leptofilum sp.]|uniref:Na+/H+ antiporter subunit B n=1 Tax=Candidatus Leptofilum sp. TaxID=3241576 RepID=UPI003B5CE14A
MRSLILTTATRYLLPLILLFSVFILFRGHHDPGGGFIAGLVASAAFALYGFANGMPEARRILLFDPLKLIGVGLLMAVSSGLISPILLGRPFMTSVWGEQEYAALGKLGTPLLFDIGVYVTVIGVTLLIILTLAEEDSGQKEESY